MAKLKQASLSQLISAHVGRVVDEAFDQFLAGWPTKRADKDYELAKELMVGGLDRWIASLPPLPPALGQQATLAALMKEIGI